MKVLKNKYNFFIAILIFLVILIGFTSCSGIRRQFLQDKMIDGWKLMDWEDYIEESRLQEALGKEYIMFSEFGLKRFTRHEYITKDFKMIHVEFYFFEREKKASLVYEKYKSKYSLEIGNQGSEKRGEIIFFRKNCLVKIVAVRNLENKNYILKKVAIAIDQNLKKTL